MKLELLYTASWHCLVIAALAAVAFILVHKRKRALRIFTVGVYLSLILLFLLKCWKTSGTCDAYTLLIAADNSLDVFKLSYSFDHVPEFAAQALGADYRAYAAFLFVLAPVLTVSNVLSFFQTAIDKLRYVIFPGTKYILSELNGESVALAESIRKKHSYAQIIFTGVGNPEKKYDTKLLEKVRELGALCLKKDVTHLYYKFPLRSNLIFLISHRESENVSDALALIEKYKDSTCKMDIYVFASSSDAKLAIDGADKGTHCLHPKFSSNLSQRLSQLLKDSATRNWRGFADGLEHVPLEGRFSVRCVDIAELTVRNMLMENYQGIHNQAKAKDHVIGITILGFGKHGAALLKNAAWIFQFYGYKLQFNIFDLDGSARKYLQQEAPMLRFDYSKAYADEASHDILFLGEDQGIDCLTSDFDELVLKTYWQRMKATQMVFVSLGDDSRNIAAAIHIRQLFQRKDIEAALENADFTGTDEENEKLLRKLKIKFDDPESVSSPLIFAVVNDAGRAKNLKNAGKGNAEDPMQVNYHVDPVATLLGTYNIDKLRELLVLEKSALKNHLSWSFKDVLQSGTDRIDEDTLKKLVNNTEQYVRYSYYRDSSVATTLHQKLLNTVKEEFDALAMEKGMDVLEIKKITEKMRWNAYMRALGYQPFDIRNDRVKFHHLLLPYGELPEEEKKKDMIEF